MRPLARDDQVDRLRTLALFIRLDVETDMLPLRQRFQSCALDVIDVNKHIAATVVGLNEPVAALAVEKLTCTAHCHRATPLPAVLRPSPHGAAARLDIHTGKGNRPYKKGRSHSAKPPTGGGTSKPATVRG